MEILGPFFVTLASLRGLYGSGFAKRRLTRQSQQ